MTDRNILEAASTLTAGDINYVKERVGKPAKVRSEQSPGPAPAPASAPQPAQDQEPPRKAKPRGRVGKRGKRSHIEHEWPEVGTVLAADYFGTHYTAEVIPAPPNRKLKSGKIVRITSGPAAGSEHISMSGAMEAATEQQRQEQDLGRKGCLSGWSFWKW